MGVCIWFRFVNWVAVVLTGLLNFHWFLSGWVAVYFGVPGLSGFGHLVSRVRVVFCPEVAFWNAMYSL